MSRRPRHAFFSYLVQSTIFYSRRPFSPPAVLCLRCEALPGHQLGRHLVVISNYAVDASMKISRCPINIIYLIDRTHNHI